LNERYSFCKSRRDNCCTWCCYLKYSSLWFWKWWNSNICW